ncbi:helix-turn-helix domain-containing protein [Bifidobacterium sp. UBA4282]|uniref:helix-turn-helix domain-containing protein n=1 Tax=Bifidobacterium sp. UBA4282 TaxID=1946096 RepID=UPI0025C3F126|nr:helix-turn-helix domain-containing protein [Bifidobacterium sp. UBA4282]
MKNNSTNTGYSLLTPGQTAEQLDIPVSTLSRWRSERRELPYVTVGRLIRYRQVDIDRWIDDNTINPIE